MSTEMIRQMRKEDYERVEKIWYQESVRVHNWMADPAQFWDERRTTFEAYLTQMPIKLVYSEEDTIMGFVIMDSRNYILEIFRDYNHRKRPNGESRQIGSTLLNCLKGISAKLNVNVYKNNRNAIEFYSRSKFVITKVYNEPKTNFEKLVMAWSNGREQP